MDAAGRIHWAHSRAGPGQPLSEPDAGGRLDAQTLGRVLDEIDYGVLLVDAAARPLYANARATRECSSEGGLQIDQGRVRPRSPQHRPAFSNALQASLYGRRSLLAMDAAGTRLSLAVVPLGGAQPGAPATLLTLGKQRACEPLSIELFARAHRLTAAESAVLGGLSSGLRPADIARQAGVTIATVRTQISVIRAKTATSSICELLHRLAALPPVTSALHKAMHAPGDFVRARLG